MALWMCLRESVRGNIKPILLYMYIFVQRYLIIKIHFYYISYNSNHSEKTSVFVRRHKETSQRLHKKSNLWNCGFGARKRHLCVDTKLNTDKKPSFSPDTCGRGRMGSLRCHNDDGNGTSTGTVYFLVHFFEVTARPLREIA